MKRKRKEARFFFIEYLLHRAPIVSGPRTAMGNFISPDAGLTVQVFDCGKRPRGKERSADKLDGAFNAALLVPSAHLARADNEVIVGAQFKQAWMKAHGISVPLQDNRTEIVGQNDSWNSAPIPKGMHMAAQKVFERLVEKELQIQGAGMGEGQHKAREFAFGTPDLDLAEMRPVGLGLFAGESTQTEKGFAIGGAQVGNQAPHGAYAAGITSGCDHLENTSGAQAGILGKGFLYESVVRIQQAATRIFGTMKTLGLQGSTYGIVMHSEFAGDCADLPVLGVEQMTDAGYGFLRDHGSS
jgi:hypothetical protein